MFQFIFLYMHVMWDSEIRWYCDQYNQCGSNRMTIPRFMEWAGWGDAAVRYVWFHCMCSHHSINPQCRNLLTGFWVKWHDMKLNEFHLTWNDVNWGPWTTAWRRCGNRRMRRWQVNVAAASQSGYNPTRRPGWKLDWQPQRDCSYLAIPWQKLSVRRPSDGQQIEMETV